MLGLFLWCSCGDLEDVHFLLGHGCLVACLVAVGTHSGCPQYLVWFMSHNVPVSTQSPKWLLSTGLRCIVFQNTRQHFHVLTTSVIFEQILSRYICGGFQSSKEEFDKQFGGFKNVRRPNCLSWERSVSEKNAPSLTQSVTISRLSLGSWVSNAAIVPYSDHNEISTAKFSQERGVLAGKASARHPCSSCQRWKPQSGHMAPTVAELKDAAGRAPLVCYW